MTTDFGFLYLFVIVMLHNTSTLKSKCDCLFLSCSSKNSKSISHFFASALPHLYALLPLRMQT